MDGPYRHALSQRIVTEARAVDNGERMTPARAVPVARRRRRLRRVAWLVGLVVVALATTVSVSVPGNGSRGQATGIGWIIYTNEIAAMKQAGVTDATMQALFNNPNTYYGTTSESDPQPFPRAVRTQYFPSLALIKDAFAGTDGQKIFPGTKAIIYDNESTQKTPPSERLADPSNPNLDDPNADLAVAAKTAAEAAVLVRSHGLQYVNAPSQDLYHGTHAGRFTNFLDGGYVKTVLSARTADGQPAVNTIEFQLQSYEVSSSKFASLAHQAIEEARAVDPNVRVFFGLSAFPSRAEVPSQQIIDSFAATRGIASGYWMNTPTWQSASTGTSTNRPDIIKTVMTAVEQQLHR